MAQALLVDTDVFSYLIRPGDPRGDLYRPHLQGATVAICLITIGELLFGAFRRSWGKPRIEVLREKFLGAVLLPSTCQFARRTRA